MARRSLSVTIDVEPALDVVREISRLYGAGAGVPTYLRDRILAISAAECPGEAIRMDVDGCKLVAQPSGELLSIVATLRALRRTQP